VDEEACRVDVQGRFEGSMSKTIEVFEIPEFEAVVTRAYTSDANVTYLTFMGEDGPLSVAFDEEVMGRRHIQDGDRVLVKLSVFETRQYTRVKGVGIRLKDEVARTSPAAAAAAAFGAAKINLIKQQVGPAEPQLAEGGIIMPKNGGVSATLAEAGVPEVAIPLDRLGEVLNKFNFNQSGNESTTPVHLVVNMNSKPFLDTIFEATRNKTVLISADAVVAG